MKKIIFGIIGLIALILGLLATYLGVIGVRRGVEEPKKVLIPSTEFNQRLEEERKKIEQDLEEKYQADKVSYDAMAKRLEMEKQRANELEEKLKRGGEKK